MQVPYAVTFNVANFSLIRTQLRCCKTFCQVAPRQWRKQQRKTVAICSSQNA